MIVYVAVPLDELHPEAQVRAVVDGVADADEADRRLLRRLLPRAELVHLRELDRLGLVLVSALVGCQRAAEPAAGDLDEDTQVDLLLPGVLLDDVDPERRDLAGRRRLGPLALRHRASEPPAFLARAAGRCIPKAVINSRCRRTFDARCQGIHVH